MFRYNPETERVEKLELTLELTPGPPLMKQPEPTPDPRFRMPKDVPMPFEKVEDK